MHERTTSRSRWKKRAAWTLPPRGAFGFAGAGAGAPIEMPLTGASPGPGGRRRWEKVRRGSARPTDQSFAVPSADAVSARVEQADQSTLATDPLCAAQREAPGGEAPQGKRTAAGTQWLVRKSYPTTNKTRGTAQARRALLHDRASQKVNARTSAGAEAGNGLWQAVPSSP